MVVSLINCMTSFFAGFSVFTMMGFMAHLLKTEVGNAVKGGKVTGVGLISHTPLKIAPNLKQLNHEVLSQRYRTFLIIQLDKK